MSKPTQMIELKLNAPFTCMFVGPTGSGKTSFLFKLLGALSQVCSHPPDRIIYCYGAWQKSFAACSLSNIEFHEGMKSLEDIPDDGKHTVMILDDLMSELSKSKEMVDLFTKHSHHRMISCFFLVQKMFGGTPEMRTISGNTHLMFLFKNPRDASAITHLAKQVYPSNVKFLQEAYADATKKPYSHLMINMHQEAEDKSRVIGNYLSTDPLSPMTIYRPI